MKIKILIVDESSTIHKIVTTAFENHDAMVESVTKGEEAIATIKNSQPDIVLADADMPRISGYDLSRQIKESPQFGGTAVLLLIGKLDAFDQEKFNASKADDYIPKPFKFDDLVKKILHLLNLGKTNAITNPSEISQPIAEKSSESLEIGDSMIDMDDMMNDIIGESGLRTDSSNALEEIETVESESDLNGQEDLLVNMDDIMTDIIGDSGLESEAISNTQIDSDSSKEPNDNVSEPEENPPATSPTQKSPTPIKLSLSQKIEKTPDKKEKPIKPIPEATTEHFPETESNSSDINLEEMLKSAEALLGDNQIEQETEKAIGNKSVQEPEETPQPAKKVNPVLESESLSEKPPLSTPEPIKSKKGLDSTNPPFASHSSPSEISKTEESLAEVDSVIDSADDLDSTFQNIQQVEDQEETLKDSEASGESEPPLDPRYSFAEDMAQLEIKPEPEDLLERLAPSAFTGLEQGKPNWINETLSYLSELSPKKPKSDVPNRSSKPKTPSKNFKTPQSVKRKEISMNTEHKGDLFVQIVGEHIKRILERSLEESIGKEIAGLSATIERSVREIVKEVTPEIARSIIQEEIEKIRKLEEV